MKVEQLQTENNAAGGLSDLTDVLGAAVSPAPTFPPVLDVCCGPKGMWFNKHDPRALYIDRRREYWKMEHPSGTRTANIDPDEIGDFTAMRFPDNTFSLVVMDPPHIPQETTTGMVVRQYGNLSGDWREMLRIGFKECFRVLKPDGVLIFKWNECRIPVKEILVLSDVAPLFGHKSGKFMQTHWVTFMKTPNVRAKLETTAPAQDCSQPRKTMSNHEYAFPVHETPDSTDSPGMTLRDYFAAKAMHAGLTGATLPGLDAGNPAAVEALQKAAVAFYVIADAMVAARERA